MALFIKAIAGALIVVLISIVSSTKNYFLAGLIPLFPTFALIAHIIVGQKGAMELKNTALFGMLSIIPYFAYLLSVYILSNKLPLYLNLIISTVIWFIFAFLIYLFWIKVKI
jgi:membrane protein GlpM